jgi:hypothetical protein
VTKRVASEETNIAEIAPRKTVAQLLRLVRPPKRAPRFSVHRGND